MTRTLRTLLFILLPSSFILALAGCQLIGVAAYKLTPPPTIQPKYMGLQDQSLGVMVWADRGLRIDWPTVQIDLANAVQNKLKGFQASKGKEAKTLVGTTFPVIPASIVRYQRDHPEIEAMPVTDFAPRLTVSRLIYVEVEDFATRSDQSVALFRGFAKATVKVVEVQPDGTAKVAFEQNDVQSAFPEKAPKEGIPNAGDARIYVGLIDGFATEIARLFVQYQLEDHPTGP